MVLIYTVCPGRVNEMMGEEEWQGLAKQILENENKQLVFTVMKKG